MVLQLIVLVLVLAIAFYQAVQGVFNSLIMMMLTVLCMAVAFEHYEAMARALLYETQGAYAEAASLAALFIIPLIVLRIVLDRLVAANVVMSMWVERIAGGVTGLITALILVGVFCTVLIKLPLSERIMGYTSHHQTLEEDSDLLPMSFTLGLVDRLSRLGLAGQTAYFDRHPDFKRTAFCQRNTAGMGGRLDSPVDALTVIGLFEPENKDIPLGPGKPMAATTQPAPVKLVLPHYPNTLITGGAQKTLIVRLTVSEHVRNDEDNWWRLPATHFRLVSDTGRSYYPVAYLTKRILASLGRDSVPETRDALWQCHTPDNDDEGRPLLGDLAVQHQWHSQGGPGQLNLDWVYSIPMGEKAVRVVFRRVAAESVESIKVKKAWPPAPDPKQALYRQPQR